MRRLLGPNHNFISPISPTNITIMDASTTTTAKRKLIDYTQQRGRSHHATPMISQDSFSAIELFGSSERRSSTCSQRSSCTISEDLGSFEQSSDEPIEFFLKIPPKERRRSVSDLRERFGQPAAPCRRGSLIQSALGRSTRNLRRSVVQMNPAA